MGRSLSRGRSNTGEDRGLRRLSHRSSCGARRLAGEAHASIHSGSRGHWPSHCRWFGRDHREGGRPRRGALALFGLWSLRVLLDRLGDGVSQAQFGGYTKNGGFAEYVLADPDYVAHIPAGLAAEDAAPMICAGITTYKGIKETEAKPGEWIAISGVGGLGHLAMQYAKAMGLLVCAIDIDDGKLAHAKRLGADLVINAKTGDPAAAVKKATGGGAHGVLITAPSLIAFKQGVGMTRKRGTCVLVGLPPGEFPVPLFDVVANCITIRGSFVGTRQDMAEALAFAVKGKVKADIELQPLSSINQIFDRLEHGDVASRVVLDFAPAKTKKRPSAVEQHLATASAGSAKDL